MGHSAASAQILRGRELELEALHLRKAGRTYEQIHDALGCAQSTAYRAVMRALRRLNAKVAEEAEAVRTLELQRLDDILSELWPHRGEPAYVDRILRVMERRAKLLGLDAPDKYEHTGDLTVRMVWEDGADATEFASGPASGLE